MLQQFRLEPRWGFCQPFLMGLNYYSLRGGVLSFYLKIWSQFMLDQGNLIIESCWMLLNRKVKRKDQHVSVRQLTSNSIFSLWLLCFLDKDQLCFPRGAMGMQWLVITVGCDCGLSCFLFLLSSLRIHLFILASRL